MSRRKQEPWTGMHVFGQVYPVLAAAVVVGVRNLGGFEWLTSDGLILVFFLSVSVVCLVMMPRTDSLPIYYLMLVIAVFSGGVAVTTSSDMPMLQLVMMSIYILAVSMYEPFPNSLVILQLFIGAVIGYDAYMFLEEGLVWPDVTAQLVTLGVSVEVLAIGVSLMFRYREMAVVMNRERNRLADSVVNLTRTNLAYMDYANDARERGIAAERQRITRDIHDIVGYTLTNNMMLMEAAQDIMVENALALPAIIETARDSAQEGLGQVRAAMYKLREQEAKPPAGMSYVARLCRLFEQATGIRVVFDLGDAPLTVSHEVDSGVYHLVQESLVNSFRHGRATEVTVVVRKKRYGLSVRIADNGRGAHAVTEGIGIRGMRERISAVGGTVTVANGLVGFVVDAWIPGRIRSMEGTVRVLIADDQKLFADGLQVVLESRAPHLRVVGIAATGAEAVRMARDLKPDVILMDVRMPEMDGVVATRIIHQRDPQVKILILTTFDDDEYVSHSLKNGAIGYLLKNRPAEELLDSIRALAKGIIQLDPAVSLKAFQQEKTGRSQEIHERLHTLTRREREILAQLVAAKRIADISDDLSIAEQTVRNHISNIYMKLNIHDRVESSATSTISGTSWITPKCRPEGVDGRSCEGVGDAGSARCRQCEMQAVRDTGSSTRPTVFVLVHMYRKFPGSAGRFLSVAHDGAEIHCLHEGSAGINRSSS